ncbi:MAG: PAS domain-containing methyl-accepting chemotaxis protein [Thalassobaculaceae bacterium]|nr:PAS domain-containing methyl-accepting chemotaxis protein [Thalassobaculaceae bacterium]
MRWKFGAGHNSHATSTDLRAIYQALSMSQAVIQFAPDGTIIEANENFCSAMGYARDEILAKHHQIFVDPAYAASAEYRAFWDSLRKGEFQQAEFKRFGKGGSEVWIQATYNPLLDSSGKVYRVIKFATDVTERKLKDADTAGQLAAIGKSQAIIEFNLDGSIITANDLFLGAVGYRLDEIAGKHHRMFVEETYGTSDDYARFWDALRVGEFQQAEFKRFGKGGREIWIHATYNPIFDMDGRPFKVVKFAVDVTAEVQGRQRNERLTALIMENMDSIADAVRVANAKFMTTADASHEVSATVQQVASGTEQLDSSVQEIARSTAISTEQVAKAIEQTGAADTAVSDLTKSAEAMGGIIDLISDIAAQINLLALNATIESARAGEAGKGFAVVAGEVKSLASQVATATSRISTEIDTMQSVSSAVVSALATIKTSIGEIESSVTGVGGAVEEQAAVTREISQNMQVTSQAVSEIDNGINDIRSSITIADTASTTVRDEISAFNKAAA